MYKTFDKNDYENILAIINDSERVFYANGIREEYSHDELGHISVIPDIVVKVASAKEVSDIMKYAYANCIPVTPRGAGTGLVGAAVPIEKGIVIDMSGMNNILELDEDNLTVTVEPGVLLMTLAEYTTEHDFFYPPDPGEKTATIGGNINTNAGGMRAVKYGVTRDFVRGLELVLPNGDIITVGGKTVKNSSGYDLKDLVVGSEGTLAIITKAVLRLLPLPKKNISLLVPFDDLKSAIDTVPMIIRSKTIPTAVEFMQKEVIEDAEKYLGTHFPDNTTSDAYLLLKFDGNSVEEIENDYDIVAKICLDQGARDVFILDTEERNDVVWKARGAFLEAIKNSTSEMDEVDVVVPRSRVNEMVDFINKLRKKSNVRIKYFGHAGDGNLHIYVLRDNLDCKDWDHAHDSSMKEMYDEAFRLGGQVSGEHGIGYVKRPYLSVSLDEGQIALMRGIKAAFDPKNILNPHKVCEME